jgi:hypothetical protein
MQGAVCDRQNSDPIRFVSPRARACDYHFILISEALSSGQLEMYATIHRCVAGDRNSQTESGVAEEVLMDVFQEAAKAAERRHGAAWLVLSPQEQTRCIYEEMRRIDAELSEAPKRAPRQKSGPRGHRSLAA